MHNLNNDELIAVNWKTQTKITRISLHNSLFITERKAILKLHRQEGNIYNKYK
eukprot:GAHX01003066.1.p1 GENE.GAHX01003066.1~~GAHX01003066.1.p1  ORF type:complete len:53 (+),score=5.45 GAHX01003066.1:184-342(+)